MWVSIAVVPITAISSIIYFRYCNKQFSKIDKAESKMTTAIQENVNAARVVRAFSNEKYEFDKMDVLANSYRDENVKFNNVMAIYWALQDVMVFVQFAVTMAVSISLAKKGLVTVAEVSAVILLLNMLVFPMRGLGRIISSFGKASVAANRIGEVLDTETEYKINGNLTPQIKGNIEFNNVSFKFKDDDRHLLNGISFKIKAGQTIALVGKTGSGKSTICNLLARFLEIDSGSITIDGVDIRDIDKKHLRSNIRYVVQDPFLFSKTLYENIAISKKNITENEVISAAKTAAIHDDVLKFKQGYETIVGEKGTTLSGGQKQRVAIARMLVDESPVIIFDDSLSALDTKTDVLIRKALKLKSSEQTMIIITHRITTAKEADLILVLDDGIIKEMGTHDELVKNDGLYSKLWGIQGELENEYMNVLKDGE
jgi:ATP-binding cassette subfamily B protein